MASSSPLPQEVHPIQLLQTALYVMCGGGTIGARAAQHPATFRIRPGTKALPYSHKRIYQMAAILIDTANALGFDPTALPPLPHLSPWPTPQAPARIIDLEPFLRARGMGSPRALDAHTS